MLILGIACVLLALWFILGQREPAKANALDPVADELLQIRKKTGMYPTDISVLSSLIPVRERYTLYFGQGTDTNLAWSPSDVSSHDLTVLVTTNYFVMFAPTGKIKLMSFSSFPVWRRTSDDTDWQKGRIHWSLIGTYWSED